jgi:hypothetical protein
MTQEKEKIIKEVKQAVKSSSIEQYVDKDGKKVDTRVYGASFIKNISHSEEEYRHQVKEFVVDSYFKEEDNLREPIQNAIDACKAKNDGLVHKVTVNLHEATNSETITDDGIGMGEIEALTCLFKLSSTKDNRLLTSGHKGAGLKSILAKCDNATIISKKDGEEGFEMHIVGYGSYIYGRNSDFSISINSRRDLVASGTTMMFNSIKSSKKIMQYNAEELHKHLLGQTQIGGVYKDKINYEITSDRFCEKIIINHKDTKFLNPETSAEVLGGKGLKIIDWIDVKDKAPYQKSKICSGQIIKSAKTYPAGEIEINSFGHTNKYPVQLLQFSGRQEQFKYLGLDMLYCTVTVIRNGHVEGRIYKDLNIRGCWFIILHGSDISYDIGKKGSKELEFYLKHFIVGRILQGWTSVKETNNWDIDKLESYIVSDVPYYVNGYKVSDARGAHSCKMAFHALNTLGFIEPRLRGVKLCDDHRDNRYDGYDEKKKIVIEFMGQLQEYCTRVVRDKKMFSHELDVLWLFSIDVPTLSNLGHKYNMELHTVKGMNKQERKKWLKLVNKHRQPQYHLMPLFKSTTHILHDKNSDEVVQVCYLIDKFGNGDK